MKLSRAFLLLIVVTTMGSVSVLASTVADARVTYKVVDEKRVPGAGEAIRGGGWIPDGSASSEFRTLSDTNGLATVELRTAYDIGCTVTKTGYYDSEFYYAFGSEKMIRAGRWPQSGFTNQVVLKHIRNPIPMYIKSEDVRLPVEGTPIGYDLMKGDWVSPHGKGIVSDLVICVTGSFSKVAAQFGGERLVYDLFMRVTFSNSGDGIQTNSVPMHNENYLGSRLVTDHEAPFEGYHDEYTYRRRLSLKPSENINASVRDTQIAYFRIRTRSDAKGKIESAMYGFMLRDFNALYKLDGSIRVSFMYYLNPDGTRNVECAEGVNLLR
ncbi:MAG: hypothetical protein WCK89_20150 [bacterium]